MGLRRIINKSIVIGTLALSVVFSANCIYAANIESMENFQTTKTYDVGDKITPEGWIKCSTWGTYDIVLDKEVRDKMFNSIKDTKPESKFYDGFVGTYANKGYLAKLRTLEDTFFSTFKSLTPQEKDILCAKLKEGIQVTHAVNKQREKSRGEPCYGENSYIWGYIDDCEALIKSIQNAPEPTTLSITLKRTGNKVYNNMVVKYGTHTYGCANQAEYDAVVNIVEGVKSSSDYKTAVKVLLSDASKRKAFLEAKNLWDLDISDEDKNDLAKMYILQDLTFQALNGKMDWSNKLDGNSAYGILLGKEGGDCTAVAMVYSLIYDVAGFNTIVVGGHNHAWVRVQVSSGNWYSNLGEGLKKAGGTFQFSLTSETFD